MAASHPNSFKARKSLKVGGKSYTYFSLAAVEKAVGDLSRLPFSLRILMENLVRHEDGTTVKKADIAAFLNGARPCPADINRDGDVTSTDFFNFLTNFFAGNADFNNDGLTNSNDFFTFLAAFAAGC